MSSRIHERVSSPLETGPTTGRSLLIQDMMRLHWKHFGWDEETGRPTEKTLAALELGIASR